MLALRPSRTTDADFLYRTSEAYFRPLIESMGRKWSIGLMQEKCHRDAAGGCTSIIEVDGRSAGFLTVERRPEEVWIESLVLQPEYRRQGIGDALMSGLMSEAGARGVRMRLGVLKGNPAQAYWERHGFEVIGEFDPQHHLMERPA